MGDRALILDEQSTPMGRFTVCALANLAEPVCPVGVCTDGLRDGKAAIAARDELIRQLRAAIASARADIDEDEGNFADAEETLDAALALPVPS
jgi:hypothetical protein